MKKIIIVSIAIAAVMMGGVFFHIAGDIGDDMVNIITLIAAVVILALSIGVSVKYINQMKTDKASGELADENWDGIGEYKNELPIGWALSFIGTMIWAAWYWTSGYPLWAYSQIGEWNEEVEAHHAAYEAKWANASETDLRNMGQSLYLVQCAPCHGITADGMDNKAADLTHRMSYDNILDTVVNGANNFTSAYPGGMPGMDGLYNAESGAMLTEAEAQEVSRYVANGMNGAGAEIFAGTCASCHGANGEGMAHVGPNIVSFDNATMTAILTDGRRGVIGEMPSYDGRLTPVQIEALTTYINSLQR